MPALRRPSLFIAILAATAFMGLLALSPAHANAASVRTTSPVDGASLVGAVKWTAATDSPAKEVRFVLDGVHRWTEYNAPYTFNGAGYLDTAELSAGAHKLTVRALVKRTWVSQTITVYVTRPSTSTGTATGTTSGTTSTSTTDTTSGTPTTTTDTTTTISVLPNVGSLLFADKFDEGSLAGFTDVQAVSADRIQAVAAPAGRSGRAARFEVRYGDHVNGEPNSRSELSWSGTKAGEGDTLVYDWATYFPSDFVATGGWMTTTQWKGEGTGGPPIEMGVDNGRFGLWSGPQTGTKLLWSTPIERSKWLDIKVRVHFSESPSLGWVELWYKGQQVLQRTSFATLLAGKKNYFKFGLYRQSTIQQTGVMYHAGLRIARAA